MCARFSSESRSNWGDPNCLPSRWGRVKSHLTTQENLSRWRYILRPVVYHCPSNRREWFVSICDHPSPLPLSFLSYPTCSKCIRILKLIVNRMTIWNIFSSTTLLFLASEVLWDQQSLSSYIGRRSIFARTEDPLPCGLRVTCSDSRPC